MLSVVLRCFMQLSICSALLLVPFCISRRFNKGCGPAEEHRVSFLFSVRESESGERGYFSDSSEEPWSFFRVSKEPIFFPHYKILHVWMELRSEDTSSGAGWRRLLFSRKSLWLFFGRSRRPGVWVISREPHGFFWFMLSCRLTPLTFLWSISVPLTILLCVGLWSLKVLENEKPAATAGWDPLWAFLDAGPSCPFLCDRQLQASQRLHSPAAIGPDQIKLTHCQRQGTRTQANILHVCTEHLRP